LKSPAIDYVCADDDNNLWNFNCIPADLVELSIQLSFLGSLPGSQPTDLTPAEVFAIGASTGNQGTFTAVIDPANALDSENPTLPATAVTADSVKWATNGVDGSAWIFKQPVAGSGHPEPATPDPPTTSYFYNSTVQDSTDRFTVNAVVDFSAGGLVVGNSAAQLSFGVTISHNPDKAPTIITFPSIPSQTCQLDDYKNPVCEPVPLLAVATCSRDEFPLFPIVYTSATPGVCYVNGLNAQFVSGGTCTILADQGGDADCAPANEVPRSFGFVLPKSTPPPPPPIPPLFPPQPDDPDNPTCFGPDTDCPMPPTNVFPPVLNGPVTNTTSALVNMTSVAKSQSGLSPSDLLTMAPTVTQSITFKTAASLGSVAVLTQGAAGLDFIDLGTGTCVAGIAYSAGASCTVDVAFTPTLAGNRYGAVVFTDSSGNPIGRGYLQGTGLGPQLSFLPGTESVVPTSGLNHPSGVSVDGSGSIYISDSGNNRVLKETLSAGSYSESMVMANSQNYPSGVAVDGGGNIYYADSVNNWILINFPSAGSYIQHSIPTSALTGPNAVAVDGSGNVYIADTLNQRVLKETLSASGFIETVVPTSSLLWPIGVAVDGSGNVYIADSGNNRVLKETVSAGSYSESSLPTSTLNGPFGVALDGNGNVYIADSGNDRILKETLSAGAYTETIVPTSSPLNDPVAVAVDGTGNVYIADLGNNRVLKEDFTDPPSLSFASTSKGSVSVDSPQLITVQNIGNATLTFPVPSVGNDPSIAANFTLNSTGATACPLVSAGASTAGILAAGQSCQLAVSFTPTAIGTLNSALVLTDNALNAAAPTYAAQNILLSGTATGNATQAITFQTILNQTVNSTVALTATTSSALPVSFTSITPSVCTISSSTTLLIATGTCFIQANQIGNSVYAAAPTVTQSFSVNQAAQTIQFGSIPAQTANSTLALSATASSGLPVSYSSATPTICAVSGSTASLLVAGTCTVQAYQSGNANYMAAPPVTQSFTVGFPSLRSGWNFGAVNAGIASGTMTLSFTFSKAATLGSTTVLTQGATGLDFANAGTGSCTAGTMYGAGATCTVNVTFTPTLSGTRYGAVVLEDNSENVIATGYLQGTGVGPQVSFLPGVESILTTSSLNVPSGVAVDGSGNVYVVDTSNQRVLKETLSGRSYTESTLPIGAQASPTSVAVDGAGNVYIADANNNVVLEETLSAGSYTESTVPTSALSFPSGVAVDGSGNVYIADSGNNRVLIETLSGGGYTESTVPTSGLYEPSGVAVDGNGNVYIADTYNQRVLVETQSGASYTEKLLPTSALNYPGGIAVDGNGNVYIADTYNQRVLKETSSAGGYTERIVPTSTLGSPQGIAVTGNGDVYVIDAVTNRVLREDFADPPTMNFALTAPGSTSSDSPQTVTVENNGNAALSFSVPPTGSNPSISANFSLSSSGTSACPLVSAGSSTAGALPAGQACLLPISFTPSTAGNFSGAVALTDNAPNVSAPGTPAQQSILLSGTGTGSTQQTITFGSIPVQAANLTLGLVATASSGLPVSFTSTTPATCTVSASTAMLIVGGTCTIQANQGGNSTYAPAPAVTQSFAISQAAQTITFDAIPTQVANPSVAVSLMATASSGLPVSFASTTPTICTVSASTVTLIAAGTCTVQASQAGSAAYLAAPVVSQSVTVAAANPPSDSNFGSVNIGQTSPAMTFTLTLGAADTLSSVSVLTQGATGLDFANAGTGTCATGTSFNAGASCTVNVTFTPTLAGIRYSALEVTDSSGNIIATAYLQGTGVGPQVNFIPGAESKVPTSVLSSPYGAAVDGSGNIYIADWGNNRVLKETPSAGGYTESTVQTSALSSPYGVAVDGSGSVYIADYGNNRVLMETPTAGNYIESTVPTSGLCYPSGVAVDGSGNVYIVDSLNERVLMETLSAGNYVQTTLPSSAVYPTGVAVDGYGDVYVVDNANNRVLKETLSAGSYTESTVTSGALLNPGEVTVDGSGNIYIVDSGNNRVLEEKLSAGSYIESTVTTSTLSSPGGIVVAGNGNVYVADTGNNRILKEDLADPPSLSFALTAPGSTSSDSPHMVAVENVGNAALNFPVPSNGTNPNIANNPSTSTNFTLNSSGASACPLVSAGSSTAGSLAAGQSCLLAISFAPTTPGSFSGTMALTDNALNATGPGYTTQSLALSGIGTGSTQQTITFGAIPAQNANSTFALTATASSGLPVSFTSTTPTICTVSLSTASLLAPGTCTIQTNQGGSSVYAAAPVVTQSFTVNLALQTITFGAISTQSVNASVAFALTATASSGLSVSYASTTPTICTVSATAVTFIAAGTCTIQATQAGNTFYAAAPMVSQSITVEPALALGGVNVGAVNIGSVSSAISVPVTFSAAATLGSVSVSTQGAIGLDFVNAGTGTCTAGTSYSAGGSCTVNVMFAPILPGARYGAVVLYDGSGNVIATSYLQGTGVGPQVNFLPGTINTVPTGSWDGISSIALDGSGNIYVVDYGNERILKETLSAGGFTESTVPTSTLSHPNGLAVDGSGNVYIADTYNNRVLKETLSTAGYSESTVSTSSLSYPWSVALDGSGNLYVVDSGNKRVLRETLLNGTLIETAVPTSSLSNPTSMAVDGGGNVYIVDAGSNRVLKETLLAESYTESALTIGAKNAPEVVAVDASSNVYIGYMYAINAVKGQYGYGVLKETPSAVSYALSTLPIDGLGPYLSGVAVDGGENVYIASSYNIDFTIVGFSAPPILSFAMTAPGTTSADSPQTVTVENVGNATLNLPAMSNGNNPSIPVNFTLNSGGASACPVLSAGSSTMGLLQPGQSCLLPISFMPTAAGTFSSALTLTDNTLNAPAPGYTAQNILLNGIGTGAGGVQQTITFWAIPAQAAYTTISLTATASSGLPVVYTSATPTICTVSASSATLLAFGTCSIQANQMGNTVFVPAPMVSQSFAVGNAVPLVSTNVGSVNIGASSSPTVVPITFSREGTLGSVTVLTEGVTGLDFANAGAGTCTAGIVYNAGNVCTMSVTFTPTLAGVRYGAVVLEDGSSNVIATSYLQGTGVGPQVNFLPGSEIPVPTSAGELTGVAVDGSGNIYIGGYHQASLFGWEYSVFKETFSSSGYTESTVPSSALSGSPNVAIDGGGNVYIADPGNNRVLKETLSAGSYTESTVPTSALNGPEGVAVDGSGNIYIADCGNKRVLKETLLADSYIESVVATTSPYSPRGIAVDGSSNVYVINSSNGNVLKLSLSGGSYAASTLSIGNFNPEALAADRSGNVYVTNSTNGNVLKFSLSGGSYTASTLPTSASSYSPGIAVDANGNIYVADYYNTSVLKEDFADAPSLTFAATVVGSTSSDSPQTITLENFGTSALNLPVPSNGNNPNIAGNFTLNSSGTSSCPVVSAGSSTAGTLAAGQSCLLPITFAPTTTGTLSGTLVVTDNSLNATAPTYTAQSIILSGTSSLQGTTPQTITFGAISSQSANSTLALAATSSSGLPVAFASTTPTICTVSASTATLLAAGTCTIQARQPGNGVYGIAPIVTQSFTVNLAAQTINFPAPTSPVTYGVSPITLSATATSGLPVTFSVSGPATVGGSTLTIKGAGAVVVTASQQGNSSYASATAVAQTIMVNPATLTVKAANASRVYGTANPTFTDTIAGFVNGDTAATATTGAASLATTATTTSAAGSYTITAAAGTLAAANYSFTFVNGTLTVTKAVLTVTANNASRTYGAANPTFTDAITGFVNGDTAAKATTGAASLTTTATTSSTVGSYTITGAAGTLAATNYSFVYVNGMLTVTKAVLTVTATNASRTYGAANPTLTDNITGFVNGDTVATATTGTASLTTTATASSAPGSYTITAAAGTLAATNYSFTYANGTLTVTKAVLTVTTTNASRAYGAANPTFTDTITGFVNGDTAATAITGAASLTTTATTSSAAGSYTITAAAGTLAATNYTFTYVNGTLTVTKAVLTVTANNASRAYGAVNPTFADTITGFVNGDTVASATTGAASLTATATTSSAAGSYAITAAAGTLASTKYSFNYVNGTLTVTKAVLTVTANSASRAYGAANPAFTDTITGFVNGDTVATATTGAASLTTAATTSSALGTYTITAAAGALAATNYTFTYVNGTLTVNKAVLTVTANNASRAYGAANPTFTDTITGFVNGDTVATATTGAASLTTTATTSSAPGSYAITAAAGTLAATKYSFTYVNGTFTVNKVVLTVTANNASRIYGAANPTFADTITGFVNGDTVATATTGAASLTTTATTSSSAGSYTITAVAGTLASTKYSFTYVNGTLTVTKAALTVTANNASRAYGAANPTFTDTITGFVNGDTVATATTGAASLTTTATTSSAPGTFAITAAAGTLAATNYAFTYVNGTLTVSKAVLTVTANNASRAHGAANPTFTDTINGFVNGDTVATATTGAASLTTTATTSSTAGTYTITAAAGTLAATKYSFVFVNGTLTITP
jgi:streptogramin lyase